MMKPIEYEHSCKRYFEELGNKVELTPHHNDYGVDLFVWDGDKKIAVQAKMYGGSSRKVNRKMIMELHGAKDYFDCDSAILITNGNFLKDAKEVATKLGIKIIKFNGNAAPKIASSSMQLSFDQIWESYIMPLEGKILYRDNGKTNKIVDVNWGGLTRITSSEKQQFIEIEPFQFAIKKLLTGDSITRDEINQIYPKRASSGIVLILEQIPYVVTEKQRPKTLRFDFSK